jgi:microcystin-dependent protein
MDDVFLGEIRLTGFNFAPIGWALCQGQMMPISTNTALFSLLGTTYGGDGVRTFALPNLQGSVGIGFGQGPGLGQYTQGQTGGATTVTLTVQQSPAHTHTMPVGSGKGVNAPSPTAYLAGEARGGAGNAFATPATQSASPTTMAAGEAVPAGGGQAHNNMAPYVALNYIIALQGIFPSRP